MWSKWWVLCGFIYTWCLRPKVPSAQPLCSSGSIGFLDIQQGFLQLAQFWPNSQLLEESGLFRLIYFTVMRSLFSFGPSVQQKVFGLIGSCLAALKTFFYVRSIKISWTPVKLVWHLKADQERQKFYKRILWVNSHKRAEIMVCLFVCFFSILIWSHQHK